MDSNALASSIVLVCRPRAASASGATRREFVAALKAELPTALRNLQQGNIAPVDLAQAAIGPGMAVYTRYSKVLDAEGKPLRVRDALALINQVLDETLAEQEGDFDADSRFALAWKVSSVWPTCSHELKTPAYRDWSPRGFSDPAAVRCGS
jgi:putative DNA methylase